MEETSLDIRETMEAREEKCLQFIEFEELEDGLGRQIYECPVCGETIKDGSEEHLYSPVGDYHIEHLSEEELEYAEEHLEAENEAFGSFAFKAEVERMNRALAGDAAGRHGAPPDLPKESAMYGLEHDLDDEEM